MNSLEEFEEIRSKIQEMKEESDKAAGALAHLREELKKKFDCNSIEEAKELLEKMKKELNSLNETFDKKYKEFQSRWKGSL